MPSRPDSTTGRPDSTPHSLPESVGVVSVSQSQTNFNPSVVAEEVAEDMTLAMFDNLLSEPLAPILDGESGNEDNKSFLAENEQLQAELASARSEIEFAGLKEEELEKRNQLGQRTIEDLKRQVDSLLEQVEEKDRELQDANRQIASLATDKRDLEGRLSSCQQDLSSSQGDIANVRAELECAQQLDPHPTQRERSLEDECAGLRERVSVLETELSVRKDFPSAQPTVEFTADSNEETPLLAAAYQQISVLNTQLAHLYTELTMARTEVQHLRGEQQNSAEANASKPQNDAAGVDTHKQSQQIADLVSDIRHLQLDLEYHQQKLDQMIEEKQQMMKDLKKSQTELAEAKQQVEARDQMLKHREVDLAHLKEEMKSPRMQSTGSDDGSMLVALRTEAAAKDSALIVSHYELHKEKLMRDRLEQKNLKLMERMQKLMMVVETMRKENITLERALTTKDQKCEEATQKARQMQKLLKASKGGQKGSQKTLTPMLELEQPSKQSLPPLERSTRSVDSAGGRRSGLSTPRSTPRTPRGPAPPSPYGTRS